MPEEKTDDQLFVEYVVRALVDNPDKVSTTRTIDEMGVLIQLSVDPQDMGKVIGKDGRTAKAIRVLLRVLGAKKDARVNMKIVEPEGAAPRPTAPTNDTPAYQPTNDVAPAPEQPMMQPVAPQVPQEQPAVMPPATPAPAPQDDQSFGSTQTVAQESSPTEPAPSDSSSSPIADDPTDLSNLKL